MRRAVRCPGGVLARSRASCAAPATTRPRSAPAATPFARAGADDERHLLEVGARRLLLERAVPVARQQQPLHHRSTGDLGANAVDVRQRGHHTARACPWPGRMRQPRRAARPRPTWQGHRRQRRSRTHRRGAARSASGRPCPRSRLPSTSPGRDRAGAERGRARRRGSRRRRRSPGPTSRPRRCTALERSMEGVGLNVAAVGMEEILPRWDENGGVAAADLAREAFRARDRGARRTSCSPLRTRLDVDDLERLAITAYLLGRDEASARAWERAHPRPSRPATVTVPPAACSGWRSRSSCAERWPAPAGGGPAPSAWSRMPNRPAHHAASCSSPTSWSCSRAAR